MSAFGKIALLLSSKANRQYTATVGTTVFSYLINNATSIQSTLGQLPRGYILVTDSHPSASDTKSHYTVDAYGLDANGIDEPIGTVHVYEDGTVQAFTNPRSKAWAAYKVKAGTS